MTSISVLFSGWLVLLIGSAVASEAVQPWDGAALSDWKNADHAIVLTQMNVAEPATAFSPKPKKGHWLALPYEMRPDTGGHKGTAIWCGYESDPPDVKLKLGAEGWHAIFVGIPCGAGLWLKLNDDRAPLWRTNSAHDYYVNSVDTYFKVAELKDDSSLILRPQRHGSKMPAAITHVLLIPLTEAEIERLKKDRADDSHRTMAATYDGFSPLCGRSPRTEEDILAEVEEYRDSDYGAFIIHAGWSGDKTFYPSEVGYMPGGDLEDVCADYHRSFIESTQELARKKINPLKVLIDGAHDVGMKAIVGLRPAGWSYYQPYNGLWDSPFYLDHPQWRCVDRIDRGSPELTRMSWAVPEVRAHIIDLLSEQVGYGADGAHIVFNRGFPVVLYEQAFCDMFKEKHGIDPNEIGEEDPRVIEMRADLVCMFFKELRDRIAADQKSRGEDRRIEISAMVLGDDENNRQYGVDVARLCREKLLDVVYVYPFDFGATKGIQYDGEFFRQACQDHGVPYYPTIDPPYDLKGQLPQALALHDSGAAGLTFWDAGGVDTYMWAVQSRLGHLDEVRWRQENLDTTKPPRKFHFYKWWGAQRMDVRFPPYWGG